MPALSAVALACLMTAGAAQAQVGLPAPLAQPAQLATDGIADENGIVRVIVQFNEAPVSRMRANMNVLTADRAEMAAWRERILAAKRPRLAAIAALGGRVQNTMEHAINAAVIDVPARRLAQLRKVAGVKSVRPAGVYRMNQSAPPSVAQLIRTAQVNAGGNTGQGVAIAIIDSGVDYMHASFGGPGSVAAYQAAVAGTGPTTIGDTPGFFPDGPQVKGGYDWLGDTWGVVNNVVVGTVTPDPDPIDNKQVASDFAGHGTNSASAAAGQAVPGGSIRAGSAPGATLLAYRGCSRISSACEGSALLNSVDSIIRYAAGDPNGNQPGAANPALPAGTRFVINMSLGASFGNPQTDDLSEASRNAVRAGITVVASAGNSNNIPFITGTPGGTDLVISVAASQPALLTGPSLSVASLGLSYPLVAGSFGIPLVAPVTAPLALAGPNRTAVNNVNLACSGTASGTANPGPASPAIPGDVAGSIGLSDRGTCGFNEKALNTQRANAVASVIINNAANAGPIGMAAGPAAPSTTIPSYSMGTAEGAQLKQALIANPGLQGTISPLGDAANVIAGVNAVDLISDFSSRGATQNNMAIKPDVTAPGSNIFMANVGTGNGGNNNSGTSFASPLAAGAAALVLSAKPSYTPWEVKAALMNTANPQVFATKTSAGSTLAGITRMGAGRVDAERAVAATTLAWDGQDLDGRDGVYYNASLSFGQQAFTAPGTSSVSRTVVVKNYGSESRTYQLGTALRFANDAARGVSFSAQPSQITVAPGATGQFQVVATATGSALPTAGGLPLRLTHDDTCTTNTNPPGVNATCTGKFDTLELDGFVTIDGGADSDRISLPFMMVARQASDVSVQRLGTALFTRNAGAATTNVDVFNLLGGQDAQDQPATVAGSEQLSVDLRAVGVRYLPNAAATASPQGSRDLLQFAVGTWQPLDTLRSAVFNVEMDVNNDGVADFTVANLNTSTNQSAVFVTPTGGNPGNAFFFTQFPLNSARAVMTVYPSVMGVNANSRIGVRVRSSNFFGGPALDALPDAGGFLYFRPSAMVNVPSSFGYQQAPGTTLRVNYTSNSANLATSPGDKGLLFVMGENPVARELVPFQLQP